MNADGTRQTRLTKERSPGHRADVVAGRLEDRVHERPHGRPEHLDDGRGTARNAKQLTFTKQPEGDPAWAPDGSVIAFFSKRADKSGSASDIWTMKPDGTDMRQLTTAKGDDIEPSWSRDSQKLVFTSNRNGGPGDQEIYLMNRDGTGQTRLTDSHGFDRQPDW